MIRKVSILLVALAALLALPEAASAAPPPHAQPITQVATTTTTTALACQQTFHTRPASTGAYFDPCATFSAVKDNYSYSVTIENRWECISLGNGCHITSGWTVLRICRSIGSLEADAISVDANSMNFFVTKVAFLIFDASAGSVMTSGCDDLTSPIVAMKGCGSNDGHLLGVYPQVVSYMGRGRGTIYGHNPGPLPDFQRIPTEAQVAGGLFNSNETYYWIGRGGVC